MYSVQVTFFGNPSMAGYQMQDTYDGFMQHYICNNMTNDEAAAAAAATDTSGKWATHGDDILAAWNSLHSGTFDSHNQILSYVIDWPDQETYSAWQEIKETMNYSHDLWQDIDITFQYLNKTEVEV